MTRFLPILFAACALTASCVQMSPAECKGADWYALGVQDGRAGETLGTLDERRASCAEAGVQPDMPRYMAGRDEGLRVYCDPRNAVEVGLQGNTYKGVCPPESAATFRRRYEIGREVYLARQALGDLDRRRNSLEEKVRKSSSDDEKRDLRQQLSELDPRLRTARNRLGEAERALQALR